MVLVAATAWILWLSTTRYAVPEQWELIRDYPTYETCVSFRDDRLSLLQSAGAMIYESQVKMWEGSSIVTLKVLCLPANIDPRESKR